MIHTIGNLERRRTLVLSGHDWHRGVLGIVASRVVGKYHRPTLLLDVQDGMAVGSGRSIDGFNLHQALEKLAHLFERFGGHMVEDVTLETDFLIEGYSVSYANLDLWEFLRLEGKEIEDLQAFEVDRALGRLLPEQTLEAVETMMDSDVQRRNDAIELHVPMLTVKSFLEYIVP